MTPSRDESSVIAVGDAHALTANAIACGSAACGCRQRLQPVDVVAILDPANGVIETRRPLGCGSLGSGDLPLRVAGSPCLRFGSR